GVGIDSILPEKDLQISGQMPKHVENPDKPCNTDDDFLANRRLIEGNERILRELPLGSRRKGRDRHIARLLVNLIESIARPRLERRDVRISRPRWEQHRLSDAASLVE